MSKTRQPDGLTQKQASFVAKYVECGRAGEAYRHAYQTKASDATVNTEASRLLRHPAVEAAIKRFRAELQERAEVTVADVVRELWDNAMKAKQPEPIVDKDGNVIGHTAQIAASNQALVAVGKHLGAFDHRAEPATNPLEHLTPDQRAALRRYVEEERERRRAAASSRPAESDPEGAGPTLQ